MPFSLGLWQESLKGNKDQVEIWRKGGTKEAVFIEPLEDEEWVAWWFDKKRGVLETIACGPYEEVKEKARKFMEKR